MAGAEGARVLVGGQRFSQRRRNTPIPHKKASQGHLVGLALHKLVERDGGTGSH